MAAGLSHPRLSAFSVLLPVYNEEAILEPNTETLVRFLSTLPGPWEILIGSNGSTDRTVELGEALQRRDPHVRFFHLPAKGPGLVFRRAIELMRYDHLVCLDADLPVGLEFITAALRQLDTADIVIGSKKMGNEHRSLLRRWGSSLYVCCARTLLGLPFDDYSIGAKAYRRSVLDRYHTSIGRGTFYVQKLVWLAARDRLTITEIPVQCEDFRRSRFNLLHEGLYRFGCLFWLRLSHGLGLERRRSRNRIFHTSRATRQ